MIRNTATEAKCKKNTRIKYGAATQDGKRYVESLENKIMHLKSGS